MRNIKRIDNQKTALLLQEAFRASGKSQTVIAGELRLNQSQISRLLCGKLQRASAGLNALCMYLGVKIAYKNDHVLLPNYPQLSRCLSEVLDGTKRREKAVVKLLRSARNLS